ncbi:MAG: hypothetical protein M1825_005398 [Sarcosagium campestre]|nr:MAG: hypothetical protein M1825_005398 [Sarcosagium campestre]
MVKLQEVEDEHFANPQPGPVEDEDSDGDYTDTDSSLSTTSGPSSYPPDETLLDRLVALRDIIPPKQRVQISSGFSTAKSWLTSGLTFGGKTIWVVSTGALLIGVPFALAFTEEAQMQEMEREMKAQQSANEVLTPGATTTVPGAGGPGAKPAL